MSDPTPEDLRQLVEWKPPLGVISIYLRIDPSDRAGGWRTEVRNGLARVLDRDQELGHDAEVALRATARRVAERFEDGNRPPPGRGQLGFVEVASSPAREHWWSTQLPPDATAVAYSEDGPLIAPLVALVSAAVPRGIALLSTERVRLLEWSPGKLEKLHDWELTLTSGDWRERKAARTADPASGQGVTAAGHDQFDDRLNENRQRFLGECGGLAAQTAAKRTWSELIAFGPAQLVDRFREGAGSSPELRIGDEVDLISAPVDRVESAVEGAISKIDAARQRELIERVLGEVRGGTRASAGPEETLQSLGEGRVDHLVVASDRASEELIRQALATDAKVTIVEKEAAELLGEAGGVVSLLRY